MKRVYEKPSSGDGKRVLVDRLWPRGLTKERAKIDLWLRDLAPSNELRNWYGHDPEKWTEFKKRYWKELDRNPTLVSRLAEECRKGTVTFVFSSKEEKINNAVALREYIESSTGRIGRQRTGFTDRGTLK
jgi:uncharacterized protein YeaO (DUF488 family)